MRTKTVVPLSVYLIALSPMTAVLAHHSAVAFDMKKTVEIAGEVTEWTWANPHCLLKLDVRTDAGEVVHWVTETQAPANMVDAGWRKNDLKPGDRVTVTLQPAKNGNPVGRIVRLEFENGKVLEIGANEAAGDEYHLSGAPTN